MRRRHTGHPRCRRRPQALHDRYPFSIDRHGDERCAGSDQRPACAAETGFFHPHFITGIEQRSRRQIDSLLGARNNKNLIWAAGNGSRCAKILCQRFPQGPVAGRVPANQKGPRAGCASAGPATWPTPRTGTPPVPAAPAKRASASCRLLRAAPPDVCHAPTTTVPGTLSHGPPRAPAVHSAGPQATPWTHTNPRPSVHQGNPSASNCSYADTTVLRDRFISCASVRVAGQARARLQAVCKDGLPDREIELAI